MKWKHNCKVQILGSVRDRRLVCYNVLQALSKALFGSQKMKRKSTVHGLQMSEILILICLQFLQSWGNDEGPGPIKIGFRVHLQQCCRFSLTCQRKAAANLTMRLQLAAFSEKDASVGPVTNFAQNLFFQACPYRKGPSFS